jgi:hypothetical protein
MLTLKEMLCCAWLCLFGAATAGPVLAAGAAAQSMASGAPGGLPAQRLELLQNGGFEGSALVVDPGALCPAIGGWLAAGWQDNSCWKGNETAQVTFASDGAFPHSGSSAARVELQSGIVQIVQPVELEAGVLYRASVWLRSLDPMSITLSVRQAGPPYTDYLVATAELQGTGGAWQRLEVQGYAPTEPGLFLVRAEAAAGGVGAGTFHVDDASLSGKKGAALELPLAEKPIQGSLFGMHIHDPTLAWPALGPHVDSLRIWDADGPLGTSDCAQWACTNPAPGVFQWQALDLHVARALAGGAEVIYNLGRTPQWASARPDEESPYGLGQAAEPAEDAYWRAWVSAVGQRYQGQIRYWEIWNEPNDASFYSGTIQKLVSLADQAHEILKAIDPMNQIVSPSPYSLAYLDAYLAQGGGASLDVVGYHFYLSPQTAPEYLYESYIPNARLILDQHGLLDRPLWNTESGWFAPPPLPKATGVGYLARSFILTWAAGVERYHFYSWDGAPDAGVALAQPPGYALSSSGVAYAELTGWLVGASMLDLERQGDVWTVQLERPGGSKAHIVWDASGASTFAVPAEFGATLVKDLAGGTQPLSPGGSVTLGVKPLLFE